MLADSRSALDLVDLIREWTLEAALKAVNPEPDIAQWSVVQIIEVLYPTSGSKLRTRTSRFSPKQWANVRQRVLENEFVLSVTLQPG